MDDETKLIWKWVKWGAIVVVALVLMLTCFTKVSVGERGVKTRVGTLVGEVGAGLNFKLPWDTITTIDVQTQKEQVDVEAASSDLQDVHTVVALNYNVMPNKVSDLYVKVGENYKVRIIDPAVQEAVKASTAKYTASDLIQNRPKVRDAIQADLTAKLAENFIQVSDISIVDFKFSQSFNTAIEAKVTAEQNALASKNLLEQKKYEAEQIVVTAKANAEAIQIQAQAIAQQGGSNYVANEAVKKWNGMGCVSQCFGAGTQMPVPFLNLNK